MIDATKPEVKMGFSATILLLLSITMAFVVIQYHKDLKESESNVIRYLNEVEELCRLINWKYEYRIQLGLEESSPKKTAAFREAYIRCMNGTEPY